MISIFFNRKYLEIYKFVYRTGSVFLHTFSCYEIDFINNEIIYYLEKNNLKENIIKKSIDQKLAKDLKQKIFKLEYYNYQENYINKRFHDGNQWSLLVEYKKGTIVSSGSNAYPENYNLLKQFINDIFEIINAK